MIIQKNGVKRKVDFPCQMCVSLREAKIIVAALQRAIDDNVAYGWIDIAEMETGGADTQPLSWSDPA